MSVDPSMYEIYSSMEFPVVAEAVMPPSSAVAPEYWNGQRTKTALSLAAAFGILWGAARYDATPVNNEVATSEVQLNAVNAVATVPLTQETTPSTQTPAECISDLTSVVYYADQAPVGSNHFGPVPSEQDIATPDAFFGHLVEELCGPADGKADSARTVGYGEFFGTMSPTDAAGRDQRMVDLQNDHGKWNTETKKLVDEMKSYNISFVKVSDDTEYFTYYMKPNAKDGRPEIQQSREHMKDKMLLKMVKKDAEGNVTETKFLKVECDGQPVTIVETPDIPPTTQPPTTETTPTTRPTTSTTRPTSSTSTTSTSTTSTTVPKNPQPIPGPTSTSTTAKPPSTESTSTSTTRPPATSSTTQAPAPTSVPQTSTPVTPPRG